MKIKNRKNRFYLLLILFSLSILPVVLFAFFSIQYFNNYVVQELRQTYQSRLDQVETELEVYFAENREVAHIMVQATSHLDLDLINTESLSEYETIESVYSLWDLMNTMMRTSRFVHSLYYINSDLDYIISSDRLVMSASDFADNNWIYSISQDIQKLPPRFIPAEGERVFTQIMGTSWFFTPSSGFFIINTNLEALDMWLSELTAGGDSRISVYNEMGDYLCGGGVEHSKSSDLIFETISSDGKHYVLTVGAAEFYSFSRKTLYLMIVLILILILLSLVVAAYISNRLYSPVANVIDLIDQAGTNIPDSRNELHFIGDMFLRMIQEQAGMKQVLEQNKQAIKENRLKKLFFGDSFDEKNIWKLFDLESAPWSSSLYGAAIVYLLPKGGENSISDSGPGRIMALEAYESIRSEGLMVLGIPLDLEKIALFITVQDSGLISPALMKVRSFLEESLDMESLAVLGGLYPELSDVQDSFQEAGDLMDKTVPDSSEQIIIYTPQDTYDTEEGEIYPWAVEARIIQVVQQGESERVEKLVKEFISEISCDGSSRRDHIEMAVLSLISGLVRSTGLREMKSNPDIQSNFFRDFLQHSLSLEDTEIWLNKFLTRILDQRKKTDPKLEQYRNSIGDYIEDNYTKDISLENIADWTGISYSYIRKIFSNLFGVTFLEYIHAKRIDKARELLRETNLNVNDVAQSVGYMNNARFSRNFSKLTGCTPSDYRIRVRNSLLE